MRGIDVDFASVYGGLKDFQRESVEYVFERLYGPDPTPRFLIADEVGLGKTLVARGLIAKTIEHLADHVRRIDVVYVCSNSELARQNIRRLNVTGREDFAPASRITLLPAVLRDFSRRRLNFVSFTPGTSFDLKSAEGIAPERALLFRLLRESWGGSAFKRVGARHVFRGGVATDASMRWHIQEAELAELDPRLVRRFARALERHDREARKTGEPGFRDRFDDLCERFRRQKREWPEEDRTLRRLFVGELRDQLARVCLEVLEPDLIILDEFQRFKDLLRGEDAAGELAQQLFSFRDRRGEAARVILLSATPYKMYTVSEDSADDHYEDLVDTLDFLFNDEAKTEAFRRDIEAYRQALFTLDPADLGRALSLKARLERSLRRVMVRTERLASTPDRNGMLVERKMRGISLEQSDLTGFTAMDGLARRLDAGDVLEYWKSAPYLLTFMDDYKLMRSLERAQRDGAAPLRRVPMSERGLSWDGIEGYTKLDPANARLRSLMTEMLDSGAWRLLWIPPSFPYYRLGRPFDSEELRDLTKRLIFSSWAVAPKAVASLLSYEAERRMLGKTTKRVSYSEARDKLKALLRFSQSKGRSLPGMPVLALMYPSPVLARIGDPLEIASEGSGGLSPDDVLAVIKERLAERLRPFLANATADGRVDEKWYWAAPILLDLEDDPDHAWLSRPNLAAVWTGEDPDAGGEDFERHVQHARWLSGFESLGRPPDDLIDVLARLALAGPGIAALRALSRISGGPDAYMDPAITDSAASVAWAFRSLFNVPEAMAVVRQAKGYWKAVLDYCAAGCLQAVLDEYAHVLVEWLGLVGRPSADVVGEVAAAMRRSISLRTARYEVRDSRDLRRKRSFRARFALRFGDTQADESRDGYRSTAVREAFNSPFWPFVLVTTSVGQEGLDFHLYCHAVVHWNLPANPVDLEQREGRVHRYKGHAIRKNLATAYREAGLAAKDGDPWQTMFDEGSAHRNRGENDLVPSWIFVNGPARIERLVPALPLSRDQHRLEALKRSLAAYRLAFGQPRQEDLIAFLGHAFGQEEVDRISEELRIDLSPPGRQT